MWANGDDVNDNGEVVRLYQPIPYRGRLSRGFENPTISRIGGPFSPANDDDSSLEWRQRSVCSKCQDPMVLLAQLHVPLVQKDSTTPIQHRTIQVFGCNRASCFLSLFDNADNNSYNNTLSVGGGGVVACRRFHFQQPSTTSTPEVTTTTAPTEATAHAWDAPATEESPWDDQPLKQNAANDDWGVEDDDANVDMQGIESMVAEMEMKSEEATSKKKLPTKQPKAASKDNGQDVSLPCFEVHSLQEPARRKADMVDEDDEDEDDNVGISSSSDDKIQQMLARYMAEEEDEEILAALRGGSSNGGGGGGKKRRERDERLDPEDRALFAFTDRIKRAPRQVIRYARGGTPMWSVPVQADKGGKKGPVPRMPISKCSCGAERVFECQLLPSLLHVLEVDKYARSKSDKSDKTKDGDMNDLDVKEAFESGGMNWGSIAIYTCSQDCDAAEEELVVVQDSLDGKPQKMNLASDQVAVLVQDQDQAMDSDDDNEYNDNWDVDDCEDDDDDDDEDAKPTKLCSLKIVR